MIKIKCLKELADYESTILEMEKVARKIKENMEPEQIWLLSHNDLYTKGKSATPEELLNPDLLPVHSSNRGGRYTYHGKGQRIGYIMLNLPLRQEGVKSFVFKVEKWLIDALSECGLQAFTKPDMIGVWVKDKRDLKDKKIAAIGTHIIRGVTTHGFALNSNPNMDYFKGIIPCGIRNFEPTSLKQQGIDISVENLDKILIKTCPF